MPNFSIIIPTYNSESTIKECLESILSQTYFDYEILIMDGLSSDKTLTIVDSIKDNRIRITTEKDLGVYDAMNKGIDLSSGEWLYFLGSDDKLYSNDTLFQINEDILSNPSDFLYGNAFFIERKYFHDGEFDRIKLFQKSNICHQAIFYKKTLFERLGKYNLTFPIYADWDFNIRCFSTPDIIIRYIELPIALYNDLSGLSNSGVIDENFFAISGPAFVDQANYNKEYCDQRLKETVQCIENSKNYKLGSLILLPIRKLMKLIKK